MNISHFPECRPQSYDSACRVVYASNSLHTNPMGLGGSFEKKGTLSLFGLGNRLMSSVIHHKSRSRQFRQVAAAAIAELKTNDEPEVFLISF